MFGEMVSTSIFSILLLSITICTSAEQVAYIIPDVSSGEQEACAKQPCYNLSYYTLPSTFINSNTILQFMAGIHTIGTWVEIDFVTNVTLRGTETDETIIRCTGDGGFAFFNVDWLFIEKMTLLHCGTDTGLPPVKPGHPETQMRAALWLDYVTNLFISHVIVRESAGYGLHAWGLGNATILGSAFVFNSGQTEFVGGNAELWLCPTVMCLGNSSITLTIKSSTFAHGIGGYVFPPGLAIHVSTCVNVNINIIDTHFFNNTLKGITREETSGSLGIVFDHSGFVSGIYSVTIENCFIEQGSPNGLLLSVGATAANPSLQCFVKENTPMDTVYIFNTTFLNNSCPNNEICFGGGMAINFDEKVCRATYIHLRDTVFVENYGSITVVDVQFEDSMMTNFMRIENSLVKNGMEWSGAGLSISLLSTPPLKVNASTQATKIPLKLEITGSYFIGNKAALVGGGIFVAAEKAEIVIVDSIFLHNTAPKGAAICLSQLSNHPSTYRTIRFNNVHFINHSPQLDGATVESTIATSNWDLWFNNCNISHNSGTGLSSSSSRIFFRGSTTFLNNTGESGGALSLCSDSTVFLYPNTDIYFVGNHANNVGGGLYIRQDCSPTDMSCFFEPVVSYYTSRPSIPHLNITMHFTNNTAGRAGDALYGGYIDVCPWTKQPMKVRSYNEVYQPQHSGLQDLFSNFTYIDSALNSSELQTFLIGVKVIDYFYRLENQQGLSPISSDPLGVCLCTEDNQLDCNKTYEAISIYPGASFKLKAVVVGQRNGVVPGVVLAKLQETDGTTVSKMGELQGSQSVGKQCTQLNYTIYSTNTFEVLFLTPEHVRLNVRWYLPPRILNISLLSCPLGFILSNTTCKCECVEILKSRNIKCDINIQMILRPQSMWIGYTYGLNTTESTLETEGVLVHNHCPFDYCQTRDMYIDLNHPNTECTFNRSGTLCGSCLPHLSLTLGSSKCVQCSNNFLALLLPFILAGLALVFLLALLNLTVAQGTLNGLILYANIVHSNRAIFFPDGHSSPAIVFIAWINLDLGIETCFFSGMNAYIKTWLQLVFPVYIWAIVLTIIILSHYYTLAAKLFRRHAVKVLATLFLLSYAKLQRYTISALSFTTLVYPGGHTRAVWLPDGNVPYLEGKHIPLFSVAVSILVFLSIPYTLLLLFAPCLQRNSGRVFLKWVAKMKPLFDAYCAPYKDKYRFWTGFLLTCLNISFIAFSFNTLGDPALNLLITVLIATLLLTVLLGLHGVYRNWTQDILEASFYVNLTATATVTLYVSQTNPGKQAIFGTISVVIAFVTFMGIVFYHIWKYTSVKTYFKDRCTKNRRLQHQLPHDIPSNASSEESEGGEPAELQPLVLEFDQYREPVLKYADDD